MRKTVLVFIFSVMMFALFLAGCQKDTKTEQAATQTDVETASPPKTNVETATPEAKTSPAAPVNINYMGLALTDETNEQVDNAWIWKEIEDKTGVRIKSTT